MTETIHEQLRKPPMSIEAEQAVIGGLILSPGSWDRIAGLVSEDDFYRGDHRMLFRAITQMIADDQKPDVVTLSEWLQARDCLEQAGGMVYLGTLAKDTPSAANIKAYAGIVHEKALLRNAILRCEQAIGDAFSPSGKPALEIIDETIRDLMAYSETRADYECTIKDGLSEAVEAIDKAFNNPGEITGVSTGLDRLDSALGGFQPSDFYVIGARPSIGKAQPMYSKILMPDGSWKTMGEISLGDNVASVDGDVSTVVGVFPQGEREIYRVTTKDGRTVDADAEHLWAIESKGRIKRKIVTTKELIRLNQCVRYKNRIRLVSHNGDFGRKPDIEIDPWLVGLLIGDGCLTKEGIVFANPEKYIQERVARCTGSSVVHKKGSNCDYFVPIGEGRTKKILKALKNLGLRGKKSHEKTIPEEIMKGDKRTRELVLAGLMESDGWIQNGSVQFSTSSKTLAHQIRELVWSLGGTSFLREKTRCKYTYNGEDRYGRCAYLVTIILDRLDEIISSPRILAKFSKRKRGVSPLIKSIEKIGVMDAQCIQVSHPSRMYITDNYVATHNTAVVINFLLDAGVPVGFVSTEQPRAQVAMRSIAVQGKVSLHKMRTGKMQEIDWPRITNAVSSLKDRNVHLYDNAGAHINDVVRVARKWKQVHGIEALYVDYLQRLDNDRDLKSRKEKVDDITRKLKNLARELNIPVIALAQVNRECEKRPDKRPQTSDLADSSDIEKEADELMFLYRDEVYNQDTDDAGVMEINITKNRHGPIGRIKVTWLGEYTAVENWAPDHGYGHGNPNADYATGD